MKLRNLIITMLLVFCLDVQAEKSMFMPEFFDQADLETLGFTGFEERSHLLLTAGKGNYLIADTFDVEFGLFALATPSGFALGGFRQSLLFQEQLVEFKGQVICLAVDPENGRAWIGAIITENNSENPSFMTEIHQPGRDVWFRVLDTGFGSKEPDRSTFMGFEGAGGIITSEDYCEAQIWPNDPPNDRTNPVIRGNILIRPNTN